MIGARGQAGVVQAHLLVTMVDAGNVMLADMDQWFADEGLTVVEEPRAGFGLDGSVRFAVPRAAQAQAVPYDANDPTSHLKPHGMAKRPNPFEVRNRWGSVGGTGGS